MKIQNEPLLRKKIALYLKAIRKEKGISQVILAEQLGVPQSFISKYESGEHLLDILELRQICQILGISYFEFIRQMEEKLNETK